MSRDNLTEKNRKFLQFNFFNKKIQQKCLNTFYSNFVYESGDFINEFITFG